MSSVGDYLLIDPGPTCAVVRLRRRKICSAVKMAPKDLLDLVGNVRVIGTTVIFEQTAPWAKALGHDLHETIQIAGWLRHQGCIGYTRNEVLKVLGIPGGPKAASRAAVLGAWRREFAPDMSDRQLVSSKLCRKRKNKSHAVSRIDCPLCGGTCYEHRAPLVEIQGEGHHFWDALALWAAHLERTR